MDSSGTLESFEQEYSARLRDYLTGFPSESPHEVGARLHQAGASVPALCRLHHTALEHVFDGGSSQPADDNRLAGAGAFLTEAFAGYGVEASGPSESDRDLDDNRLRLLESTIANANDIIVITEAEWIEPEGPPIVYVNEAFERLTGFTRAEALGQPISNLLRGPGTSPETLATVRRALMDGKPCAVEILNYRKNGTEFWAELTVQPIADQTGRFTHWVAVRRDMTERRQAEDRLRHVQKMEAIGQLTAGVAHNFNNLLTVIQGNAELLDTAVANPAESVERRKTAILTAVARGAELVRRLMVVSRGNAGEPSSQDLNLLVKETGVLMERILPAKIQFELKLEDGPLMTDIDPSICSQVLLNLIVNARDAMPDGGLLTLSTGRRMVLEADFKDPKVVVLDHRVFIPGEFAFISVADAGIGMTAEIRRRIFEPFFTTKPEGQGTGLGLATTLGFVSERGGFVEVESEPGRGTVFRIFLPISDEESIATLGIGRHRGNIPTKTALVAEDETEVRRLIAAMLEDKGFTVLTAKDGAEAIRIASQYAGPIQLVVADKAMPLMYGDVVIRLLAELRPECRFILTSGSLGAHESVKDLPVGSRFLPKPFGRNELFEILESLMQAPDA
jgi:PAS domain S-box-containing protein